MNAQVIDEYTQNLLQDLKEAFFSLEQEINAHRFYVDGEIQYQRMNVDQVKQLSDICETYHRRRNDRMFRKITNEEPRNTSSYEGE